MSPGGFETTESRSTLVGTMPVRRALPQRKRRTIGAWCFADHAGPVDFAGPEGPDVGPHPHIGLQTVTWLLTGELVHRDSLGSEQRIRPGELNLMTAGRGIAHAEEAVTPFRGTFHGIQLWVAQPESTRHGDPAFEHHASLPQAAVSGGVATVLLGAFAGVTSPARRDSDHMGVELDLLGPTTTLALRPEFEHGVIVLSGGLVCEGQPLGPGALGYLDTGRETCELRVTEPTRAILLGGVPFDEPILMWWNFVARNRSEIDDAYRRWSDEDSQFGQVSSRLERVRVGAPLWRDRTETPRPGEGTNPSGSR
jgi:redox-sensitive bicupin YhaK (pirin superfamily)